MKTSLLLLVLWIMVSANADSGWAAQEPKPYYYQCNVAFHDSKGAIDMGTQHLRAAEPGPEAKTELRVSNRRYTADLVLSAAGKATLELKAMGWGKQTATAETELKDYAKSKQKKPPLHLKAGNTIAGIDVGAEFDCK
ncbi:MAG TPA: hypothetical protein VL588_07860 [Bdellovibrionota bacterium]|jgi:hypothetical protein|nr:hypothetical protein [Bdellovibrionota bacterium]